MTHHIDVGSVLKRTVCDLYSNLVTRPTGAAVRREIEHVVSGLDVPSLTVIDFSQVGLLDFSCADEVIGKLLHAARRRAEGIECYFLVRGVRDHHLEAIEAVMERYGLAVIVESHEGTWHVVGALDEGMRRTLEVVRARGCAEPEALAADLAEPADVLQASLDRLWRRGLVMRLATGYVSLQSLL
ncbi:MAG TPA: hypothetical protein VLE53_13045 [Gemmatimonadaceae bacterium]|nr:hypothetical protein [Gemmatimonadaceae bacterium]